MPIIVVFRTIDARDAVLVGEDEAEAKAVGAVVNPGADFIEFAERAVPTDVRAVDDGVAEFMFEAEGDEVVAHPVEVVAFEMTIEGVCDDARRRREVPPTIIARLEVEAIGERFGEAMLPSEFGSCDAAVIAIVFDAAEEGHVGRWEVAKAEAWVGREAVVTIVGLAGFGEAMEAVARGPIGGIALERDVDIEVEDITESAAVICFAESVADAGRDATPGVRQVARAACELVEPIGRSID